MSGASPVAPRKSKYVTSNGNRAAAAYSNVEDDEARAAVPVIGTHVVDGDPGSPWVVGGTYRLALRRVDGRWRIVAITLDTRWQTGDAGVLQRATAPSPAPR